MMLMMEVLCAVLPPTVLELSLCSYPRQSAPPVCTFMIAAIAPAHSVWQLACA
jgi:hypothetical protein